MLANMEGKVAPKDFLEHVQRLNGFVKLVYFACKVMFYFHLPILLVLAR